MCTCRSKPEHGSYARFGLVVYLLAAHIIAAAMVRMMSPLVSTPTTFLRERLTHPLDTSDIRSRDQADGSAMLHSHS